MSRIEMKYLRHINDFHLKILEMNLDACLLLSGTPGLSMSTKEKSLLWIFMTKHQIRQECYETPKVSLHTFHAVMTIAWKGLFWLVLNLADPKVINENKFTCREDTQHSYVNCMFSKTITHLLLTVEIQYSWLIPRCFLSCFSNDIGNFILHYPKTVCFTHFINHLFSY